MINKLHINKEYFSFIFFILIWFLLQLAGPATIPIIIVFIFYFFFYSAVGIDVKLICLFVFFVSFLFNFNNFSPLSGPDENAFYYNLTHSTFFELINDEINRLNDGLDFISSRMTYAALLSFFFPSADPTLDPRVIYLLNGMIWIYSSCFYIESLKKRDYISNIKVPIIFLICSPTIGYWLGNFGKDIITVSFCMISSAFFMRKKFLLSILFFILCSTLRPYSAIIICTMILPFWSLCFSIYFFIAVFGLFLVFTGASPVFLINSFIAFFYLFLSPNPISLENWQLFSDMSVRAFSPLIMLIEAIFVGLFLLLFMIIKIKEQFLYKFLIAIYCLSLTLIVVGMLNLENNGLVSQVGSLGENFMRKKIPAWPLFSVMIGFVYDNIKVKKTNKYNGNV